MGPYARNIAFHMGSTLIDLFINLYFDSYLIQVDPACILVRNYDFLHKLVYVFVPVSKVCKMH